MAVGVLPCGVHLWTRVAGVEGARRGRPGKRLGQQLGQFATEASPAWAKVGGIRTVLLSWSLSLVMGSILCASWVVQSVAGWAICTGEQLQPLQDPVRWSQYVLGSEFWSRTLQNGQSEFLVVGSMAVLSVYIVTARAIPRGGPRSATPERRVLTGIRPDDARVFTADRRVLLAV